MPIDQLIYLFYFQIYSDFTKKRKVKGKKYPNTPYLHLLQAQ